MAMKESAFAFAFGVICLAQAKEVIVCSKQIITVSGKPSEPGSEGSRIGLLDKEISSRDVSKLVLFCVTFFGGGEGSFCRAVLFGSG